MSSSLLCRFALVAALLVLGGGAVPPAHGQADTTTASPALKSVFADAFHVGAALNPSQFTGRDAGEARLFKKHFNSVTPENVMKWERIHPEPGTYDFEAADQFVAFGVENDAHIVGHTLVWHNQTPDWVFEDENGDPVSRNTLLRRMRNHIHTVVGRYADRVDGWDVVNEALNDDGSLRETRWLDIIGEDYLAKAFQYAREADPDAELYYNDYSLEQPAKRDGAVRLVQNLLDQGVEVDGIGTQAHHRIDVPSPEAQAATIEAFAALGVDVMVTELDIAVLPRPDEHWGADITQSAELREELNPYPDALPDSMQTALAERYAELFEVFLDHRDALTRVTFWGVTDEDSWLNDWPIEGRTSYPLLFDRKNEPKPAFDAVVNTARWTMDTDPAYQDATLPVDQRVEDLLDRMTLEEKIGQMLSIHQAKSRFTAEDGTFDPQNPSRWFEVGIGRIERPQEGHTPREEAEYTNAVQRWVQENTRLGIPVLFHEEGLHGVMADSSTSFPIPLAMASSWNPSLIRDQYRAVAKDMRARGAHQALTPVVDVARDPRWGRTEETFGEDPYLSSRLSVASVRGLQGDATFEEKERVIATLKHMTGHGQPESGHNTAPASLSERQLWEVFFPPFEAAIKEANALSVMASYNEIGGVPSHANRWMLEDVLREEWGFDGVVVSDWTAISQLITEHAVAADTADAARQALDSTVDIDLPDGNSYPTLLQQVREGIVSEAAIDRAVERLLRAKFRLGLFEDPYVDPDRAEAMVGAESQRDLALKAAQQGITLLKNENVLPLDPDRYEDVAVIGPHAAEVLLGGYASRPRHTVSIYEGVQEQLGDDTDVEYAEGVRITEDSVFTDDPQPHMSGERSRARNSAHTVVRADSAANMRRIEEAVELARESDLAIVALGGNEHTAREGYAENHLGDRTELDLVGPQEELVRAVQGTGTTTVTVLNHGRPAAIPELVADVPALLETWYLGQETGQAVADVLFGEVNPGGHLPVTIPRSVGQLPMFYNHKPSARRGYLFESSKPLFPFGHGLSYTSFAYENARLEDEQIGPQGTTTLSVDVTNTGDRSGADVVQMYLRDRVSEVTRPVQELRGFERVTLDPGETMTVTFEIGPDDLSFYGTDMEPIVEPGMFDLMVGHSSADIAQTVSLEVVER